MVELGTGFRLSSREVIDLRLTLTKSEMKNEKYDSSREEFAGKDLALPNGTAYGINSYFCICRKDPSSTEVDPDVDKIFVFNSTNSVDPTTGRFRLLAGASSITEYIKSAAVSEDGKTLTLLDQDEEEIVFNSGAPDAYIKSVAVDATNSKLTFTKKDDSTTVYQTKTINGASIIGEGDITTSTKPEYHDLTALADVKLDDLKDAGIYKIAHATDKPASTSEAGFLSVTELKDNKTEQNWYSNTNYAHRVIVAEGPQPVTGFYVNDVLTEPVAGVVHLAAAGKYTLKGPLTGRVQIDDTATAGTKNFTTLILNGVTITTSDNASAISSVGAETRLIVEVSESTTNTLKSIISGEMNSYGVLHGESDLFLSGNGILNLVSDKGHGIKAKDILISGKPEVNIKALHDGIHGKSLDIAGGKFYIEDANDAFSAGSDNNSGLLKISGGEITVKHCNENVFQAKKSDAAEQGIAKIRIFYDVKINLLAGFSTVAVCDAGAGGSIEIYPSVTIVKPDTTSIPWIVNLDTKYGTPTVYDNDNRVYVTAVDNVFTLTSASGSYDVAGNFTGYRIVVPNAGKSLNLNGVYLNDQSADTNAFIDYTYSTGTDLKNVKLILSNGLNETSVNYLVKKNGYVIKSTNNLNINTGALGSADLYVSCPNGYAVWVENEARIQNDGARYFVNSKYGIRANLVNFGDELAEEGYDKTKTAMNYCCDNTEYDIALYHHAYKGQERDGQINATANTYCATYIGKVVKEVSTETIVINAEEHAVTPTSTATFTRYPFLYVSNTSDTFTNVGNRAIVLTGGSPTPEVEGWKVYIADCYTKSESDAKYTAKTVYETAMALVNAALTSLDERVSALEGTALNPSLDMNGNLTLSHTSITDAGDVNLNRSEIDENGNVTLI